MTTLSRTRLLIMVATALVTATAAVTLASVTRTSHPGPTLPLHRVGELTLPGGSTRFDYESLDPGRGLLFTSAPCSASATWLARTTPPARSAAV